MTDTSADTPTDLASRQIEAQARQWQAHAGVKRLALPDNVGQPELDAALDNYRRIIAEHRQLAAELADIEAKRRRAVTADRTSYAAALLDGGKDPGTKHTDAADREVIDKRRRRDALADAVDLAAERIAALVRQHGAQLLARFAEEEQATARTVTVAAEQLEAAISAHAEVTSRARWVQGYPTAYRLSGPETAPAPPHAPIPALAAVQAVTQAYNPNREEQLTQ